MNVKVTGVTQGQANIKRIAENFNRILPEILKNQGKTVLDRSNQLVPVATGRLKNSGQVVTKTDETIVEYTEDYAVYVHENLEARHPNGQAKFLETAINEKKREIIDNTKKTAKGALQ